MLIKKIFYYIAIQFFCLSVFSDFSFSLGPQSALVSLENMRHSFTSKRFKRPRSYKKDSIRSWIQFFLQQLERLEIDILNRKSDWEDYILSLKKIRSRILLLESRLTLWIYLCDKYEDYIYKNDIKSFSLDPLGEGFSSVSIATIEKLVVQIKRNKIKRSFSFESFYDSSFEELLSMIRNIDNLISMLQPGNTIRLDAKTMIPVIDYVSCYESSMLVLDNEDCSNLTETEEVDRPLERELSRSLPEKEFAFLLSGGGGLVGHSERELSSSS
ncbi:hypothetical protein AB834_01990 [PVC group bacterium (ex Bugula neritina AB1)]|nr:hypothetical protein AB834_01990 [PVC group bacterium (ex Bugula neritina AB1)]